MLEATVSPEILKENAQAADKRHRKMWNAVIPYDSLDQLPTIVKEQMANLLPGSNKPRVCALYYGGTLGMHWELMDDGITKVLRPTDDTKELLEPLQRWGLNDRVDIVWFPVLDHPIDSTNARWPHWVSMGNAIKLLYDYFDGFAVAGGTDSLRFMTAAMHFQFPNIGKPIIAAAAQKESIGWGSDAPENLAFGIDAACSDLSGTHLAMARKLRHGLHLFKVKDTEYDAFDSPQQYLLGHFDGRVNLYPNHPRRNILVTAGNLQYHPNFRDGIFSTEITPFVDAHSLFHMSLDPYASAILFITYGAGNVRNEPLFEGDFTHIDVIRNLHARQFPLVLGSPMQDGRVSSPYEPGVEAIHTGAISGGDTTGAALLVKMSRLLSECWWTDEKRDELQRSLKRGRQPVTDSESPLSFAYGVDYREFRKQMYRNHVGELSLEMTDIGQK